MSEGAVIRAKFRPAGGLMASARPEPRASGERPARRTNAARLARQLALAHWIERAVEAGQVASYGEVARILGLTESRITQITALLGLPTTLQEAILLADAGIGIRDAIRTAREVAPTLSFGCVVALCRPDEETLSITCRGAACLMLVPLACDCAPESRTCRRPHSANSPWRRTC